MDVKYIDNNWDLECFLDPNSFAVKKAIFTNDVLPLLRTDKKLTKQELSAMTGLCEREVRSQLHDIAIYYAVICSSGEKGYRLANTKLEVKEDIEKEIDELQHSINEDVKRSKQIIARLRSKIAAREVLKKKLEE